MPYFNPVAKIVDMQDKPLRTGVIADASVRASIAKEQGEVAKLSEDKRPEAQLLLAVRAEEAQTILTIGDAMIAALTSALPADAELAPSRKLDLFEWAIRIKQAAAAMPPREVEFGNDDMDTITARVSKVYPSPLVIGQVLQAIKKDKPVAVAA